jgi:MscS family membrane protein
MQRKSLFDRHPSVMGERRSVPEAACSFLALQKRPAEPGVATLDPLGRSTPQGTVFGFMKSATQEDYEQALRYLDTKMTGTGAQKLLVGLRTMLERGFSGKLAMLSNKPEGYQDDDLPPFKELVDTVKTSSGSLDILLERVQRGNNPPIWLFSAEPEKRSRDLQRTGYPRGSTACNRVLG